MTIIKQIIYYIVKPFAHICNSSFINGVFPNKMKIAKVIPIFKKEDNSLFTNYRPISLLPQFSKILEKLFNNRLDAFIEKHDTLSSSQYGFRSKMSTSLALLELTEEITTALDNKKCTIGVFIDLKKAFDTIDHKLLIKKLNHYGIRGIANTWLTSYLQNRQQYVNLDDENSDLANVVCGVPQGSILGPKLFILYINDICKTSSLLKFILFADDTTIFRSGNDPVQLGKDISKELTKLDIWFTTNKLSLNVSKTNFMLFSNYKKQSNVTVRIKETDIEMVYDSKFLGVLIDHKLNWKKHISMIKSKLSKTIAIMHKAKYVLNKNACLILYYSLFLPYVSYCCEVWGNAYKTNLECIYLLQKKAVRIVCNVGYREHTNELFCDLHVLKLTDLVKVKSSMIIYNANKRLLPNNLQALFKISSDSNHDTRQSNNIRQVFARTTLKSQCISIHGIKLWNSLDNNIKCAKNIHKFQQMYKKKIFKLYKSENAQY
jgi:hypothetical protein